MLDVEGAGHEFEKEFAELLQFMKDTGAVQSFVRYERGSAEDRAGVDFDVVLVDNRLFRVDTCLDLKNKLDRLRADRKSDCLVSAAMVRLFEQGKIGWAAMFEGGRKARYARPN